MNWLIRTIENIDNTVRTHSNELRGALIGGTSGFLSQPFFHDWVKPIAISIICAIAGLLIAHYGKKLLNLIDKKIDKWLSK